VFIDVVEHVNMLVSANGNLLHADVDGRIFMKSMLSGMPECRFGMNDKLMMDRDATRTRRPGSRRARPIAFDDCTFHQCVRLGRFETDRSISFIPPDGEFELCKYRITENVKLPFRILPSVREQGRKQVDTEVTVKALFGPKLVGNDVIVRVPTPKNTAYCKITVSCGKAKYRPTRDAIMWKIRKFPGQSEATLSATIELSASTSSDKKWSRPPIAMQFTVPMFTASGIHIRYLRIVESKLRTRPVKWIRYLTKGGGGGATDTSSSASSSSSSNSGGGSYQVRI
jgi:AP-2 complex subunit mu-1